MLNIHLVTRRSLLSMKIRCSSLAVTEALKNTNSLTKELTNQSCRSLPTEAHKGTVIQEHRDWEGLGTKKGLL